MKSLGACYNLTMTKHRPKTEQNILIVLILNVLFAAIEFIGGIFTNSIAILTDAIHDSGDAISIAVSYILERKSKRRPDRKHTFGYKRYSTLGALITTVVLMVSATIMVIAAIQRIVNPSYVSFDGMLIFAIIGVVINGIAMFVTRKKGSTNQKAVNLHMLDDMLGWVVVLIGTIIMEFTGWSIIDPLMSIGVSIFVIVSAIQNLSTVMTIFLDKVPEGITLVDIETEILAVKGVKKINHIHLWAADERHCYAMLHATMVPGTDIDSAKSAIKTILRHHNVSQCVVELDYHKR